MNIEEFRKKYPEYDDMSDGALMHGFYKKSYSDMPMGQFADQVGLSSKGFKEMIAVAKKSGVTPTSSSSIENGPSNDVITGFNQQNQSFVNPDMQPMGSAEGLLSSTAQGITLGWSDEIAGHMAAVANVFGEDALSYDDVYKQVKDFEEKRITDFRKTDPKKAFAGEIGGAIVSSAVVTPALALLKTPKFLQELSTGMRTFISSGALGSIYGAGTAEEGERGVDALKVGTLSAFGGLLLQKPLGAISNKYDKMFSRANQSPTIQNLKNLKNAAYEKTKEIGLKFEGASIERFRKEGLDSLDEGFDPVLNKYAASSKKLFEDTLDDAYIKGISFEKLDLLQRQLWAKLKESGGQEVKIYPFINAVNNLIKSHPDTGAAAMAAKSANKIFNKAKAMEWEFTKVKNNIDVTGNIGQKYKAAVRNILNNKSYRTTFDDLDIKKMESFLKGNISDRMLKSLGKLAPNGSFMGLLHVGAVATNPWLAIASAVTVASRSSFDKKTVKGAEKLLNYIKGFTKDTSPVSGLSGAVPVSVEPAIDLGNQVGEAIF